MSRGRIVTLVLQAADGALLGALAPFTVELPWWSEVAGVVEAARRERGAEVAVLRLLHAEADPNDPSNMGGTVTYTAELLGARPADLRSVHADDASAARGDDPLRLPWARPGGPGNELSWAEQALAAHGRDASGPPQQQRTWNLSSIWVLPTTTGPVWLKSVPPFFAQEGPVIEWLADPALPPLIASSRQRILMADIAGVDQYDAPLAILERAVTTLVAIQDRVCGRVDELFALGLPDWRWPALRRLIDDVIERHRHELDDRARRGLDTVLAGFDARAAEIDACDLPMTLVHGDFHPGNLRGDGDALRILDWGDCGVGHPLFDVAAMVERIDAGRSGPLMTRWSRAWVERRPGSDPRRAAMLIEPIAALRQAVIYRGFLDRIEASERCYHAADPAHWLRRASGVAPRSSER